MASCKCILKKGDKEGVLELDYNLKGLKPSGDACLFLSRDMQFRKGVASNIVSFIWTE